MNSRDTNHRAILERIAHRAMLDRGLLPDFSAAALAELGRIQPPAAGDGRAADPSSAIRDMRGLLWASIDNDDSRDLDQLTAAEALPDGSVRLLVAVADVASLVAKGSAIDEHARHNTTSVYTAGGIFPMLPDRLSTDLTSLNPGEDRLSVVVEMVIDADGTLRGSDVYRARVSNHAKLAYNSVAAWLDGERRTAGGSRRRPWPGRGAATSGSGRPEHDAPPAGPGGAQPGHHRSQGGV